MVGISLKTKCRRFILQVLGQLNCYKETAAPAMLAVKNVLIFFMKMFDQICANKVKKKFGDIILSVRDNHLLIARKEQVGRADCRSPGADCTVAGSGYLRLHQTETGQVRVR